MWKCCLFLFGHFCVMGLSCQIRSCCPIHTLLTCDSMQLSQTLSSVLLTIVPWTFWGPGVHATVTLQRHCYLCRSANHILCMHVWNGSSQNLSELKPDRPSVHIEPNFISCSKHDSLKLILQKPNLYYMIVNLIWGFVTQTSELFEARSKLADIRYWSNISQQLHIGLYGDA